MLTTNPQIPLSQQIQEFAARRDLTTKTGAPDLSGLIVVQPHMIYLVGQCTIIRETKEQRRTGKRRWLPYKEQGTWVLGDFEKTWETHDVQTEVDVIDIDVINSPGQYLDWTTFDGADSEFVDGLQEFLTYLDCHHSSHKRDVPAFHRRSIEFPRIFHRGVNLPCGPASHIGWLDPDDDAAANDHAARHEPRHVDDGGLSAVRAEQASAQDTQGKRAAVLAREHVARVTQSLTRHHEPIDAAIRAQDARCAKAVAAFLRAAEGVGDEGGHVVWTVKGCMNPGAEIEHSFSETIIVRRDGQVFFGGQGHRPSTDDLASPAAHPNYQPRVTLDGSSQGDYYNSSFAISRGAGAIDGQLPFYVSSRREGTDDICVHSLKAFSEAELGVMCSLIERTSDWFVATLARYLAAHGL